MKDKQKTFIISIAASIILWIYVIATVNPTVEREFKNIPITYRNMDVLTSKGMGLVGEKKSNVNLVLQGYSNDFINVKESDIRAEVDLKDYDEDDDSLEISYYFPSRLRKVDASLDSLPLRIEKIISKELKVEIVQDGTPEHNLAVLVGSILPETVVVEGVRSSVDRAERALAHQDMTEIKSNTTRNTPIKIVDAGDEEVTGLKLSQNFVNVSYNSYKLAELPIDLVTKGEVSEDYIVDSISLSQEKIALMYPSDLSKVPKSIKTEEFDLGQVKESGSYKLGLVLPEGIKLREKEMDLSVNVSLAQSAETLVDLSTGDIDIRIDPGVKADFKADQRLQVKVVGKKELIENIDGSKLKLYIDAKGIKEGSHVLEIKSEKLEGLNVRAISPPRIELLFRSDD